jgi:hypothetical protein
MMIKRTGSFIATDYNGRQYKIYIYTDYLNAGNFQEPSVLVPGMKDLRTSDGMHVNRREKGEYEIVEMGLIIHSDSPEAP